MNHSIYVIILNYNGYSDTMQCINSLQNSIYSEEVDYKIVVVDNHSKDNSFVLLQNTLPVGVSLLQSHRNAGYAYGNNIGIKYAIEHGAQYICILNNDTIITEDFISPCINYLEKKDNVAFIGPMIMNHKNGLVQNTGGNISIIKGKSYELNKNASEKSIKKELIECDFVYGAAMLFRSSLIQIIGLIPENYFLFYEETEWCYKAKQAGFINCINTKAKIVHKGSESLKMMNAMQHYLMQRNRALFVKRNGTPFQFLAFLLYNFSRILYRAIFQGVSIIQYLQYQHDGIVEKFDSRFVDIMDN